jgi:hypothetical protein
MMMGMAWGGSFYPVARAKRMISRIWFEVDDRNFLATLPGRAT